MVIFLFLPCIIEMPVFNANSADPDQTPHYAASDLDLHCLPMSLLWDATHKWVKLNIFHYFQREITSAENNLLPCYMNPLSKSTLIQKNLGSEIFS